MAHGGAADPPFTHPPTALRDSNAVSAISDGTYSSHLQLPVTQLPASLQTHMLHALVTRARRSMKLSQLAQGHTQHIAAGKSANHTMSARCAAATKASSVPQQQKHQVCRSNKSIKCAAATKHLTPKAKLSLDKLSVDTPQALAKICRLCGPCKLST